MAGVVAVIALVALVLRDDDGDEDMGGETAVPSAPLDAPSGPLTVSQIALVGEQEEPLFDGSGDFRYIVIRDSLSGRLPELREAHPEAEILLYKDASFTVDEGCEFDPFQGGGLSFCEADDREEWFLHDTVNGSRLTSVDFPAQHAMNIDSPGYRRAWTDSVLARLGDAAGDGSDERFDGIWMDDVNVYPGHGLDGRIAELTDDEYRDATVDFMTEAAPNLETAGYKTVANLGIQSAEPDQQQAAIEIAEVTSVVNRESFVRFSEGPLLTDPDGESPLWDEEQELALGIQDAGASFHAITYGDAADRATQEYARASFLLVWDGRDGSSLAYRPLGEPLAEVPYLGYLGEPTGDRALVGGAWQRPYEEGLVVLNPSASAQAEVALRGRFETGEGDCAGTIELEPASARVLELCRATQSESQDAP